MSNPKFASVLKRLERDGSTGTLVCVGEDSMFGRVYLVDGKPRAARCRHLEGKEALVQLDEASLTSTKFYSNANLIKANLDDADIQGFEIAASEAVAADVGEVEITADSEIDALIDNTDNRSQSRQTITAPARAVLVEELTEYVGPVAEMVVSGLGENVSLAEAIKLAASEIGDPELAKQFAEKVRQRT